MTQPTPTTSSRRRGKSTAPPKEPTRDHLALANQYIDDVLTGKVPAGRLLKLACKRQRDDLSRFANHETFAFDPDRATRPCRFVELLPHVKGDKAKGDLEDCLIRLEPWQCFIITTLYGWIRKDTGARRFRSTYWEVAKGNAKSTLCSALALYAVAADGEMGAEVYAAATTRDQAKVVFGDAQKMLNRNEVFRKRFQVEVLAHAIVHHKTQSVFAPLSRDAHSMEGKNVSTAILDELHAHKTAETYGSLDTACAKRRSSLLIAITTAGSDQKGICYRLRTRAIEVLEGRAHDETMFVVIFTVDPEDLEDMDRVLSDPDIWRKANPNYGVSVEEVRITADAARALEDASFRNEFLTKHLNIWVNAAVGWLDMRAWDRCADPKLDEDLFTSEPCFLGLDLATKVDIAAKAKVFYRDLPASDQLTPGGTPAPPEGQSGAGIRHYYVFVDCYLPEAAVTSSKTNPSYAGWVHEERIQTTPGDVLDFAHVREEVLYDNARHNVIEVAFDEWQARQLAQDLQANGLTAVEFPRNVKHFSAPMKELEALVRSGRLHHDGNPVLRWMISNVVCKVDANDNIFPRKERADNKIDGVVATLMALGRAMIAQETPRLEPGIAWI